MKPPVYLLAGGRPRNGKGNDTLLQTVINGFGTKNPSIGYTGTANGDDRGFFKRIAAEFEKAGAGKVTHAVIDKKGANLKEAADILASSDIVFISGGDVEYGMKVLQDNDMIGYLTSLYHQDKPFFGISAGSIMLAKRWVRWTDPDDDSSAELFPCLGFAPVLCDCHDEESGWEELKGALKLERVFHEGYGLVSGSGIRVSSDGSVQAVGAAVHHFLKQGKSVVRAPDIPVV